MRNRAMHVLATAASNNAPFQTAVLQREAGTVQWLLQVCRCPLAHVCTFNVCNGPDSTQRFTNLRSLYSGPACLTTS